LTITADIVVEKSGSIYNTYMQSEIKVKHKTDKNDQYIYF